MKDRLSPRWRKIVTGMSGGSVILLGVIAIPAPGPGWLIVFAGLNILAKEFPWAGQLLRYGRQKYDRWDLLIRNQSYFVRALIAICAVASLLFTIWLFNVFGLVVDLLHLEYDWLKSPLAW